jgi:hypothetical protein
MQWTVKKAGAAVTTGALTLAAISQCSAGLFDNLFQRDCCFLQRDERPELQRRLPARDCSYGFFNTNWRPWNTCCADAEYASRSESSYSPPLPIRDRFGAGHSGSIREEVRILDDTPVRDESTYPQRSYSPSPDSYLEGNRHIPEITDQYRPAEPVMTMPPALNHLPPSTFGTHTPLLQPPAGSQLNEPQPMLPPGDDTPIGNESSQYQTRPAVPVPGRTDYGQTSRAVQPSLPGFVPGQAPGGFVYQGPVGAVPSSIPLPNPVATPPANGQFVPPQVPGLPAESEFGPLPGSGFRALPTPTPSGIPAEARFSPPGTIRQLQPANHLQQYSPHYSTIQQPQYQTGGHQHSPYQPPQTRAYQQFGSGQYDTSQSAIPQDNATSGSSYREMPATGAGGAFDSRWRVMQGAFGPQESTNPSDRVVFVPRPPGR